MMALDLYYIRFSHVLVDGQRGSTALKLFNRGKTGGYGFCFGIKSWIKCIMHYDCSVLVLKIVL